MAHDEERTSGDDLNRTLDGIAKGWAYSQRSPVVHLPSEADLEWEDVFFPSADGTPLEGWFIPCPGSDKIIVCAHPLSFSKAGFPSHMEPWKSAFGPGNDYELNFIPDYRVLHENGYNVLAYDFRNFGHSSAANGGLQSNNRFEARDVLGSLAYVRSRDDLSHMTTGLFSRCMGANATFRAIASNPSAFDGIRAMVSPLLLSAEVALESALEGAKLAQHKENVLSLLKDIIGVRLDEASPVDWAKSVQIPTLTYGVHDDAITKPSDLTAIFEAIATPEKEMFWINGTDRRWDGYTYFQREPEKILAWFAKYMG